MTNLTEQWKKGELEDGFYYVKLVDEEDGKTIIDKYCNSFRGWEDSENWQISEVLAPVPSYEEWVYLHKARNDAHEIVESLTQENQQLKELLKYCHYYIINTPVYPQGDDAKQVEIHKLSDQITNAIGEK